MTAYSQLRVGVHVEDPVEANAVYLIGARKKEALGIMPKSKADIGTGVKLNIPSASVSSSAKVIMVHTMNQALFRVLYGCQFI